MQRAIKEQLDRIREDMLENTDSSEEVEAVENMSDEELLVLVFERLYIGEGHGHYLLSCLMGYYF